MLALNELLVPTDFSIRSDRLRGLVRRLAEATGARVHLLHDDAEASNDAGASASGASAWRGPGGDGLRIVEQISDGLSVRSAIDYCEAEDIDAVATAVDGGWSFTGRRPARLAAGLIQRSHFPVLRVPVRGGETDPAQDTVERILVPIDFSDYSADALEHAKELAAAYDASLLLYFVAEEHTVAVFSDAGVPSISSLKADPEITEKADEALQQLYSSTGGPDTDVSFHVGHGAPGRVILTFAEEQSADVIVMATHGLTGHEPFDLGSVTDRVLRRADRPVFVLKSFGHSLIA